MARGHGFRRSGPRRQTQWVGQADQSYVAVGAGAKVIIASFSPSGVGFDKPTVVRTRGEVSVSPAVMSADTIQIGAYGLAIVSDQAFAAGAASIPGPWSDSDWGGWFVWRSFSYRFEFNDATGIMLPSSVQYEIDSKAMRKVGDNETIVLMAESQAIAFDISMPLRVLVKIA